MRKLVIMLLAGFMAAGIRAEGLPVNLVLNNGDKVAGKLHGRKGTSMVIFEKAGDRVLINFPLERVNAMTFDFGEVGETADKLFAAGEFRKSAAMLDEMLKPVSSLFDMTGNHMPWVIKHIQALYWGGQYLECVRACENLKRQVAYAPWKEQATLYQVLSLLQKDRTRKLDTLMESVGTPKDGDSWAPLYWYVRCIKSMAEHRWVDAWKESAEMVTRFSRDDDWLPVALYTSAIMYRKFNRDDIRKVIVSEITDLYPDTPWAVKAQNIEQDYPEPDIKNPGFEKPPTGKDSGPAAGWELLSDPSNDVRIMDGGRAPADNGESPSGGKVLACTVEADKPMILRQQVSGFQPGMIYFLEFDENADADNIQAMDGPYVSVFAAGQEIVREHLVRPADRPGRFKRPYHRVYSKPFTADQPDVLLEFRVRADGTRTYLLDGLKFRDFETDPPPEQEEGMD